MTLRERILLLRYEWQPRRVEQKTLDWLVGALPRRWINHLTMGNLGRVYVNDPRLHAREVPTVTIQEIGEAIRHDERRR